MEVLELRGWFALKFAQIFPMFRWDLAGFAS